MSPLDHIKDYGQGIGRICSPGRTAPWKPVLPYWVWIGGIVNFLGYVRAPRSINEDVYIAVGLRKGMAQKIVMGTLARQ